MRGKKGGEQKPRGKHYWESPTRGQRFQGVRRKKLWGEKGGTKKKK